MRRIAVFAAISLSVMLTACAAPGTKVSSNSDFYKATAKSQQAWCTQFGCDCTLDGAPATCTLVTTCLNTNSCQR